MTTPLLFHQSIVKRWRLSRLVFIGNVRRERFPGAAPAMVLDFAMWCTTMSMLFIALYFDDKRLKKGPTIFLAGLFWVLTLIALCVASLSRHDPVFLKNLGDKLEFRFWVNVLVPASLFQLFCLSAFLLMVPLAVLQTVMSHHVQLKWALLPLPVLMPVPYALCWFRLRLKLYTIPVFATLASILTWLIYLSLAGFWCSASSWPLVLIPVYVVLAWMLTTVVVVLWTLITRFQRIVPGAAYLLRRWRA